MANFQGIVRFFSQLCDFSALFLIAFVFATIGCYDSLRDVPAVPPIVVAHRLESAGSEQCPIEPKHCQSNGIVFETVGKETFSNNFSNIESGAMEGTNGASQILNRDSQAKPADDTRWNSTTSKNSKIITKESVISRINQRRELLARENEPRVRRFVLEKLGEQSSLKRSSMPDLVDKEKTKSSSNDPQKVSNDAKSEPFKAIPEILAKIESMSPIVADSRVTPVQKPVGNESSTVTHTFSNNQQETTSCDNEKKIIRTERTEESRRETVVNTTNYVTSTNMRTFQQQLKPIQQTTIPIPIKLQSSSTASSTELREGSNQEKELNQPPQEKQAKQASSNIYEELKDPAQKDSKTAVEIEKDGQNKISISKIEEQVKPCASSTANLTQKEISKPDAEPLKEVNPTSSIVQSEPKKKSKLFSCFSTTKKGKKSNASNK